MDFTELEREMKKAPLVGYDWLKQIPASSGVYAAWLDDKPRCFYVGKASNLSERIGSHFSGQRGSDQFCLYVYDAFIHEERCRSNTPVTTRQVNGMTAEWIRRRVRFQWVEMDSQECASAEKDFRRKWQPLLNPL